MFPEARRMRMRIKRYRPWVGGGDKKISESKPRKMMLESALQMEDDRKSEGSHIHGGQ
jgi:hypothetical protein